MVGMLAEVTSTVRSTFPLRYVPSAIALTSSEQARWSYYVTADLHVSCAQLITLYRICSAQPVGVDRLSRFHGRPPTVSGDYKRSKERPQLPRSTMLPTSMLRSISTHFTTEEQ